MRDYGYAGMSGFDLPSELLLIFIDHQLPTDYGLHSIALGRAAIKSHHSVCTGTNEAWSLKDLFFMVD